MKWVRRIKDVISRCVWLSVQNVQRIEDEKFGVAVPFLTRLNSREQKAAHAYNRQPTPYRLWLWLRRTRLHGSFGSDFRRGHLHSHYHGVLPVLARDIHRGVRFLDGSVLWELYPRVARPERRRQNNIAAGFPIDGMDVVGRMAIPESVASYGSIHFLISTWNNLTLIVDWAAQRALFVCSRQQKVQ